MKTYQPVRWPCYVWLKDELKPRRKYLLFGPRNQGNRTASNYLGFLIVAKKGTPSWTIEQEKYECRYWVTHFWRLVDFPLFKLFGSKRAAAHLARVECASRAQEIRAKWGHVQDLDGGPRIEWAIEQAGYYAWLIHAASNYPFFAAAGWTEEDCYNEIVKHL